MQAVALAGNVVALLSDSDAPKIYDHIIRDLYTKIRGPALKRDLSRLFQAMSSLYARDNQMVFRTYRGDYQAFKADMGTRALTGMMSMADSVWSNVHNAYLERQKTVMDPEIEAEKAKLNIFTITADDPAYIEARRTAIAYDTSDSIELLWQRMSSQLGKAELWTATITPKPDENIRALFNRWMPEFKDDQLILLRRQLKEFEARRIMAARSFPPGERPVSQTAQLRKLTGGIA